MRLLPVIAGALVLAGAGWYWGSPLYAMWQLRDAAQSGDPAQLEANVDFPALREDVKAELHERMTRELGGEGSLIGDAGAAFGSLFLDRMVDAILTPTALAGLVREGKSLQADEESGATNPEEESVDWTVKRDGFSRFTAIPVSTDGEHGPQLEFARDGLGWKLVGLELAD